MNRYTTLIFDLDGTLIDSAPDLHAAVNTALADAGHPALDLATVTSFIGNGVEALVERSLGATGMCDTEKHTRALSIFLDAYAADNSTLTRHYPGVLAVLDDLKSRGVTLGLCTNKPHAPAVEICRKFGLHSYFGAIHGAQDNVPRKPDAVSLLRCMADLRGDARSTLYVGDSQVDHMTAHNAGIDFALFTGGYLNGPLEGPPPLIEFPEWSQNCFDAVTCPQA